jgi:hypothetical protein
MTSWQPNRVQWLVICAVYFLAIFLVVDWTTFDYPKWTTAEIEGLRAAGHPNYGRDYGATKRTLFEPSITTEAALAFLIVGGALIVWRLQAARLSN